MELIAALILVGALFAAVTLPLWLRPKFQGGPHECAKCGIPIHSEAPRGMCSRCLTPRKFA